ncbi:hypothetical protein ZIOFF_025626 [Zingiber officinale]|uniref:Uncharacterized protein n=1 Tax=Zingiber officinale TaxID=94328 RepID=A0A8J5H265_ZINOF|nr:hypothetical protein ZIOFF_025626 [Zingiber officinale]
MHLLTSLFVPVSAAKVSFFPLHHCSSLPSFPFCMEEASPSSLPCFKGLPTTWADLPHYYQVAPHSSNWMQQQKTNLRRSIEPNFGGGGLLDANSLGEESVC